MTPILQTSKLVKTYASNIFKINSDVKEETPNLYNLQTPFMLQINHIHNILTVFTSTCYLLNNYL